MIIKLAQQSSHLATRFAAVSVREQIKRALDYNDTVIIDCCGIDAMSVSFADECFGKLLFDFELQDLKNKVTYRNASPFINATIARALKERASETANS